MGGYIDEALDNTKKRQHRKFPRSHKPIRQQIAELTQRVEALEKLPLSPYVISYYPLLPQPPVIVTSDTREA